MPSREEIAAPKTDHDKLLQAATLIREVAAKKYSYWLVNMADDLVEEARTMERQCRVEKK